MLKDFILNQKRHCKISDGPRLNLNYVRIIPDSIWNKKLKEMYCYQLPVTMSALNLILCETKTSRTISKLHNTQY